MGRLYICHNFVAYQSNFVVTGKEMQVIVPFVEIDKIDKGSVTFGMLNNGLDITLKSGKKV